MQNMLLKIKKKYIKQDKADRKNFIFVTEYNCSSNNNISVLENECVKDTLSLKYVGYSRIVACRINIFTCVLL